MAAGGIFFLVLAGVLVAEALSPYYAVSLDLQVPFVAVAILFAICGVFLLQTARASSRDGLPNLPETVEGSHPSARIRSTVLPNTQRHSRSGGPMGDGGIRLGPDERHEER